jgi:hypothetical protein
VHDGADPSLGHHLGDERVADVGANELGPAENREISRPRRHRVDADDPLDRRVGGEQAGQPAPEEPADASDQNDGRPCLLAPDEGTLLLVASLDARLLQQLAVLLLGHPLTPLLDD